MNSKRSAFFGCVDLKYTKNHMITSTDNQGPTIDIKLVIVTNNNNNNIPLGTVKLKN